MKQKYTWSLKILTFVLLVKCELIVYSFFLNDVCVWVMSGWVMSLVGNVRVGIVGMGKVRLGNVR